MLFSSVSFLYYFLPITLILCLALPKRWRNSAILFTSLVFYAWGEPKFVIFMLISVVVAYFAALAVDRLRGSKLCRLPLIIASIVSLGMLGYFKYANFFIENFNSVTGLSIKLLNVVMPIGISFYTFQILSYVIDVYRDQARVQKNIINFAAYVTMFPQLIAGPIVRYTDIAAQLDDRAITLSDTAAGVRRFIIGLAKKVLIADILAELCETFRASGDKAVLFYWLYAVALALHIYFDFSGYSDMAIGIGKILGFSFPENFNYPFISKSISEFWRRWHMSLGNWFRDYVYIPLGGNRVKTGRWILNVLIVWGLTGFWHGAAWTFIVWGLYFAVFLVAEKFFLGKLLKKNRVAAHIYLLFFMLISFVIFNANDMKEALSYISAMFGGGKTPFVSSELWYYLRSYGGVLIAAIIGATPALKNAVAAIKKTSAGERIVNILEPVFLLVLLITVTAFLVDGSFSPFLYFRF